MIRIDRWDLRRDGPVTEAALRQKVASRGYEVSTFAWPAGTVVPAQAQTLERVDGVVTGVVKITLDGESAILTAGDIVYVPRGCVRRMEVVGSHTAHCIDAELTSNGPRFTIYG
jgi:quercetin dioxygenase-like cupin family protein